MSRSNIVSFDFRFRVVCALALAALASALGAGACSSDDSDGDGTHDTTSGTGGGSGSCEGGYVYDGKCEGLCSKDKCLQGEMGEFENTCVDNVCSLVCDSHTDCFNLFGFNGYLMNTQDCTKEVEDGTGAEVFVCKSNGKARGFGYACPFGVECSGTLACPNGQPCAPCTGQNPDGSVATCIKDDLGCHGVENCTLGRCSNDGSPCLPDGVPPPCAPNECKPLSCFGAGEGDADAYCTRYDCKADSDCPGGYYCATVRQPNAICGTNKGDNNLCGTTTDPCIDPSQFNVDGATYQEGPVCLLRNVCLKRGPCAPCETDIDCSQIPGQRCANLPAGGKACARTCSKDTDCELDYTCGAEGMCIPRFGACKGTGQFCEPCQNDLDCGDASSTKACGSLTGNQKACYDTAFPDACTTDTACPKSPSGKNGECLDEGEGLTPSDSVYHHCYFPFTSGTNKFTCW